MQIDKPLIQKLEKLAKLDLLDSERTALLQDLNKILTMVEKLEELDTTGVEPLRYVIQEPNYFREDIVTSKTSQSDILKNAPNTDGEHFRVPKFVK
ncbi:MAG: Asp-tRNA(Asn)/Glu-tRNA(Gln) amidotransferase subunit GatC [Aureispira sp.]|nr:Asp-tRNA(Asn)/Glu-tRNA(Gln) amidotransferase subunit GatC [Aureispira sp.]